MKILSIGGSNSRNSINRALACFTAQLFNDAEVAGVDISGMEIPMYSVDREAADGIPSLVSDFARKIDETDMVVLSLAENNGSFNVELKNLLDWTSRIKGRPTFNNKPMLLMATSPGARGGASVLETASRLFPYSGAVIKGTFSLPEFHKNFDFEKGVTNEALLNELKAIVQQMNHHGTSH